jgi:hypothetical protein
MKKVCAWCKKDQDPIELVKHTNEITYGICVACKERMLEDIHTLIE